MNMGLTPRSSALYEVRIRLTHKPVAQEEVKTTSSFSCFCVTVVFFACWTLSLRDCSDFVLHIANPSFFFFLWARRLSQVCFPLLDVVGQFYSCPHLLNRFALPLVVANQRDLLVIQKGMPFVSQSSCTIFGSFLFTGLGFLRFCASRF